MINQSEITIGSRVSALVMSNDGVCVCGDGCVVEVDTENRIASISGRWESDAGLWEGVRSARLADLGQRNLTNLENDYRKELADLANKTQAALTRLNNLG